jgi:hypothetical protein
MLTKGKKIRSNDFSITTGLRATLAMKAPEARSIDAAKAIV